MRELSDDLDDVSAADGFAPWDGRRVPVTLLGGYLGAGKTSALNALLARTDRPVAVVVNDVGTVNVDARLVRRLLVYSNFEPVQALPMHEGDLPSQFNARWKPMEVRYFTPLNGSLVGMLADWRFRNKS